MIDLHFLIILTISILGGVALFFATLVAFFRTGASWVGLDLKNAERKDFDALSSAQRRFLQFWSLVSFINSVAFAYHAGHAIYMGWDL